MERSPQKWKTSYKDQFRKFTRSPERNAAQEQQEGYGGEDEAQ